MGKKVKKPKSKLRKILEWVGSGILVLLIAGTSVLLIYSKVTSKSDNPNAPTPIGDHYLPIIVRTSSMEPKYHVNTAIFVKKQQPEAIYQEFVSSQGKADPEIDLTFDDYYVSLEYDYTVDTKAVLVAKGKTNRTTATNPARTMTHRLFHVQINEGVEEGNGKYFFFVNGINDGGELSKQNQYQVFTEKELYGRVTGCSDFLGGIFAFATSPWGLIVLLLIPCLYMIISSIIDLVKNEEEKEKVAAEGPVPELSEKDKERLKKELLNKMIEEKQKEKEKKEEDKDA